MVCVENLSPDTLLASLKAGRFFGSTGLLMEGAELDADRINIRLAAPASGRFIGPKGRVLVEATGREFAYRWSGDPYVRFEAEGNDGKIFLQPFFAG